MAKRSGHCPICGTWRARLQRDHIVPKWKGGTNDPANIQFLCANCHEDKTDAERRDYQPSEELLEKQRRAMNSPEVRAKLRAAWGRRSPATAETRAKMSAAHRGLTHSPESRAKMRASWVKRRARGFVMTPETRAKLSAAAKRRWGDSVGD